MERVLNYIIGDFKKEMKIEKFFIPKEASSTIEQVSIGI